MLQVTNAVYSVGVLNPNMRVFDIVMRTDYGTSYNAYIVKGEKTALIETCHDTFFDAFVDNIREVCDPAKVDYIILNHTEPDHSGVLYRLMDLMPNAQIICSQAAAIYLKGITNRADLKTRAVKDGETLDLGGGKQLRFINAPFLHWPDSMFTYCEQEKVLFSCDFFGSHYCEPRMMDAHITYPQAYRSALKNYYDAIFGPFKPYVLKGLQKLEGVAIDFCCTSHGPVLTKDGLLPEVMEDYRTWSAPVHNAVPLIPVFYCTAYGNTARVAQAIQEGIHSVLPQAEIPLYNIIEHEMETLSEKMHRSDAFCIGSPTLNKDAVPPVWQLLAHVDAINMQKRPALVFGSYGWSGEAVPALISRLAQLKMQVFMEGFKVNFVPNGEDLEKAYALGASFAAPLKLA